MILAISPPIRYFCDRPACIAACLREAKEHQPVITVWRVPMTAVCECCRGNLYVMRAERDAAQATNEADRQLCERIADMRKDSL